jgi:hypothetical protein
LVAIDPAIISVDVFRSWLGNTPPPLTAPQANRGT